MIIFYIPLQQPVSTTAIFHVRCPEYQLFSMSPDFIVRTSIDSFQVLLWPLKTDKIVLNKWKSKDLTLLLVCKQERLDPCIVV